MKQLTVFILGLLFLPLGLLAQTTENQEVADIKVKTTAVCGMCKGRIESNLGTQKGVVSAKLDLPTNIISIQYKTTEVTKEVLLAFISNMGYAADDIPANQVSYDKLPKCCQINSGVKME